jgi:hypothetical protein
MSPDEFWETLERMIDERGLGTTDDRSARDHIKSAKTKEFKAYIRDI